MAKTNLQISAKHLGQLNDKLYCSRCFWLKTKIGSKLPYQSFPGIFSSIDSYTRKMVKESFEKTGEPPEWLKSLQLGSLKNCIEITGMDFSLEDEETEIKLTGVPDQIFETEEGGSIIVDYKTSRLTKNQDLLFPVYEFQLNGYQQIAEHVGLPKVEKMFLIYTEPQTDMFTETSLNNPMGFEMNFESKLRPVEIKEGLVKDKLRKAKEIMESNTIPKTRKYFKKGKPTICYECEKLNGVFELIESMKKENG